MDNVLSEAMRALAELSYAPKMRDLDSFSEAGAGKKSKVRVVGGPTYNGFCFETDEDEPAKIARVALIVNGEAYISLTGQDLVDLEKRKGRTHGAGIYQLRLSDIDMNTRAGKRVGELVTFASDNIYIEIEWAGNSDVTTIDGFAWVSPAQAARAWALKIKRENFNASRTGENSLRLDVDPAVFIKRIHFNNANITKHEHKVDGLTINESTTVRNNRALVDNGLVPLDDTHTFDPLMHGFGIDGMVNIVANEEFKFLLTMSAPANVDYLIETLERV